MSTAVEEKPRNGTPATEERSITYTPIGEKDPLTLTVGLVEKFLCVKTRSGKIASREDIMKFMMLCKAQGLNPWVNDAFLVGYDATDGPKFQLISAHQALLKRAELSIAYDGMESGVCVTLKDGSLRERQGDLVVQGETIVGGWARVHRRDRSIASYDCLGLNTFSTGKIRWASDPAGMIVKCAEASALRKAFPSTLAQMYCKEEMDRQIEFGDRERTLRVETTEVVPSSKSEAMAARLASRIATSEPESKPSTESNETVIDAEYQESDTQQQSEPVSQLSERVRFPPVILDDN